MTASTSLRISSTQTTHYYIPGGDGTLAGSRLPNLINNELLLLPDEDVSMSENPTEQLSLDTLVVGSYEKVALQQRRTNNPSLHSLCLANGTLAGIKISVCDYHHKLLPYAYLSRLILEVRWKL